MVPPKLAFYAHFIIDIASVIAVSFITNNSQAGSMFLVTRRILQPVNSSLFAPKNIYYPNQRLFISLLLC